MAKRPAIPAEVRREILFESRHRCAVCCYPLTLELAHVVPWRETQDHSPENLIALCPNCHTLADQQNWGAEYLRRYKQTPCALAGNVMPPMTASQKMLVETILGVDPDQLNETERARLAAMFAAYLGVPASGVEIITVKPIASARVLVRLSTEAAERLIVGAEKQDPRLYSAMRAFELRAVARRGELYLHSRSGFSERFTPFDGRMRRYLTFDGLFEAGVSGPVDTVGLLTVGFADSFAAYVEEPGAEPYPKWPEAQVSYEVVRDGIEGEVEWEMFIPLWPDTLTVQFDLIGERGQRLMRTPVKRTPARPHGAVRFTIPLSKYHRRHAADLTAKLRLSR